MTSEGGAAYDERDASDDDRPPRTTLPERITAIVERIMRLRPVRVFLRFAERDGDLLSAGMGFQSVFAVFAAVFVGFAVAGFWLQANPEILNAVITIVNTTVPGLIAEGGVISPSALADTAVIGWTGVLALAGLVWTAVGWLGFMRQAVRSVFGVPPITRFFLLQKAIDLGLALGFGLLLVAGGIVSVVSTAALDWIITSLGLDADSGPASFGLRAVGVAVSIVLNTVALALIFRVLSAIPIPPRTLILGAGMGSIALAALSIVSGYVLGGVSRNPLLAGFAVIVGLLLWFSIVWRIVLLSATWIAVRLEDRGIDVARYSPEQQRRREAKARRIVARASVQTARERLERASGPIGRLRARRALRRASAEEDAAITAVRSLPPGT